MPTDTPDLRANDMIAALKAQRDHAMDAIVQLQAALAAKQREVDALKATMATRPAEAAA